MKLSNYFAVALLIFPQFTIACVRPTFVDSVLSPIKERGININETFREQPGLESNCVYAATWRETTPTGFIIKTYVTTYAKEGLAKIADLHYPLQVDYLWYGPRIHINPGDFKLQKTEHTFGVNISWEFMSSTLDESYEQLVLIAPDGHSQLRTVLSMPVNSGLAPRNCPEECNNEGCTTHCDGENTLTTKNVVLGEKDHLGYKDIIVKTTSTEFDPNGKRPDSARSGTTFTYIWNGKEYVEQSR